MKTLGEQLKDDQQNDQRQLRTERINLLLKIACVILTIGYIVWIIKTINY